MSISRMNVQSDRQGLRSKQPLNYAESEESDVTPQTSPASSFGDTLGSLRNPIELDEVSDDELREDADVINEVESDDGDELSSSDVIHGRLLFTEYCNSPRMHDCGH